MENLSAGSNINPVINPRGNSNIIFIDRNDTLENQQEFDLNNNAQVDEVNPEIEVDGLFKPKQQCDGVLIDSLLSNTIFRGSLSSCIDFIRQTEHENDLNDNTQVEEVNPRVIQGMKF